MDTTIIIKEFSKLNLDKKSIVTIGKFDGIHKGHQKLLKYAVKKAHENDLVSVAILCAVNKSKLYKLEDNIEFIKDIGINYIIVIDFSTEFYKITATNFLDFLTEYYNMCYIVVGEDFKFGRNREGDINTIIDYSKNHDLKYKVMSFAFYSGLRVSTSNIKKYLSQGNVYGACKMLSREYSIRDTVRHGKEIGRTIGYPTANLYIPCSMFMPKDGVYYGLVRIHSVDFQNENLPKLFPSLVFIGSSVINEGLRLEAHILNFNGDLYDKEIEVFLLEYKRENVKIESVEHLKKLVKEDELNTIIYFKRRNYMSINRDAKSTIVKDFGRNEKDTGSAEVQVALLTNRISYLTGHFKTHTKDNHSRRGLLKMVARRRKLLNYLKNTNLESYKSLIQRLNLRK